MEIKAKINKWDLIKLKSFFTKKKTISKGEKTAFRMGENNRKQSNWQRINLKNKQAAHAAQFQKNKRPNQKIGQRSKQSFLLCISPKKTYRWLTNTWKDVQYHSLSEKCKSKPQWGNHLTPVKMAAIKKSTNNKCWRGCGEKGTLLHCWWECKLVQPLWRTVWRFL